MADTLTLLHTDPDQLAYTFGGVAPIRRITPGSVLRLWSEDAFGGVLRSVTDLSSEKIDLRFVNPQTGPFYVDGAEPGDALALHFVSVEPARDWAASAAIPFFGGLTSTDRTATLQDLPPDTMDHQPTVRGAGRFAPGTEFALDLRSP
jgi:acetamidase/formamidase